MRSKRVSAGGIVNINSSPWACIDKLILFLYFSVPLELILKMANVAGIHFAEVRHPLSGKTSVGIWDRSQDKTQHDPVIYLLPRPDATVRRLYINPSRLSDFITLYSLLRSILPIDDVNFARTSRIGLLKNIRGLIPAQAASQAYDTG
jgi:hypothetical protein